MYAIFVHELDSDVIATITIESLMFGRTSFGQYLYSESEYTYKIAKWALRESAPSSSVALVQTMSSMKTLLSGVFL